MLFYRIMLFLNHSIEPLRVVHINKLLFRYDCSMDSAYQMWPALKYELAIYHNGVKWFNIINFKWTVVTLINAIVIRGICVSWYRKKISIRPVIYLMNLRRYKDFSNYYFSISIFFFFFNLYYCSWHPDIFKTKFLSSV